MSLVCPSLYFQKHQINISIAFHMEAGAQLHGFASRLRALNSSRVNPDSHEEYHLFETGYASKGYSPEQEFARSVPSM